MQEYDEGDQSSPYPSYQRNPATGLPTMSNNTHSQGFGGSPDGFNYGQEIHRSNPMHAVPGDEQRIEGLIESQRLLDKIPSSRGFVDCQFNGIVDLLNGNGDETTKVEVIYAIRKLTNYPLTSTSTTNYCLESMRLDYCKSGGILPYDQAVIASYFVGKEWMHETVSKIVDWFSGAYRFNIIDDQMAQLEPFRERFYQPDMPPDNWATPLPPPTFHALMEDAPELPAERMALTKTGKYQGYILNAEHAQTFYKEYLASTKWTKGSLDIEGFPEDDAGMRALVKQAFEAILNVKGFGESQSTTTAHKRAKDVTWTDQGVEIMAWRLLVSHFSDDQIRDWTMIC